MSTGGRHGVNTGRRGQLKKKSGYALKGHDLTPIEEEKDELLSATNEASMSAHILSTAPYKDDGSNHSSQTSDFTPANVKLRIGKHGKVGTRFDNPLSETGDHDMI